MDISTHPIHPAPIYPSLPPTHGLILPLVPLLARVQHVRAWLYVIHFQKGLIDLALFVIRSPLPFPTLLHALFC